MISLKQRQENLKKLMGIIWDYELTKQEIDILWVIQSTIVERIVKEKKGKHG